MKVNWLTEETKNMKGNNNCTYPYDVVRACLCSVRSKKLCSVAACSYEIFSASYVCFSFVPFIQSPYPADCSVTEDIFRAPVATDACNFSFPNIHARGIMKY